MSFSITPHRIPLRQDLSGTRSLPVWASLAGQWTSEISLSLLTSSGVTALAVMPRFYVVLGIGNRLPCLHHFPLPLIGGLSHHVVLCIPLGLLRIPQQ